MYLRSSIGNRDSRVYEYVYSVYFRVFSRVIEFSDDSCELDDSRLFFQIEFFFVDKTSSFRIEYKDFHEAYL
jgi:hypothetical protein